LKRLPDQYDVIVLGGGPAGHKAAVQAAKVGRKVLMIEREARVGGECVHRGTIPSKTLRESAVHYMTVRKRTPHLLPATGARQILVQSLMQRLDTVEQAHERYLENQLVRNQVEMCQGRARFESDHDIEFVDAHGTKRVVSAEHVIIATGSRPRSPEDIQIDHDRILDSDSILSMIYLPESLIVMGGGVIASEFATIFQALGVQVTIVDRGERPLGFLDPEIADRFVRSFERDGGRFVGRAQYKSVVTDPLAGAVVTLSDGRVLRADRVLVALGRTAAVHGLNLQAAGLTVNERGFIPVDGNCRTKVEHIYAIGDVIGPPALATSAMDQGRRAVRHALGLETSHGEQTLPAGIYTIPEISSVGLTEAEAIKLNGRAVVGRARFEEIARAHIKGETDGLLKIVCDAEGRKILGAHVIGENATELVHVAQMAIVGGLDVDAFVDHIFNFPTMAEGYRVAALDVASQRSRLRAAV